MWEEKIKQKGKDFCLRLRRISHKKRLMIQIKLPTHKVSCKERNISFREFFITILSFSFAPLAG